MIKQYGNMLKSKVRKHPEIWLPKFKKDYATLNAQKDDNTKKIRELLTNPAVAEYANLIGTNQKITADQHRLYKKIKMCEYLDCKHLWINVVSWNFDDEEDKPIICQACLKCGLDESVILKSKSGTYFYSYEDEIMYQFMQNYHYKHGLAIDDTVQLIVAREVYARIKANHPDIEESQMKKYMEIALHNMDMRFKKQGYVGEEKVLKRLFPE